MKRRISSERGDTAGGDDNCQCEEQGQAALLSHARAGCVKSLRQRYFQQSRQSNRVRLQIARNVQPEEVGCRPYPMGSQEAHLARSRHVARPGSLSASRILAAVIAIVVHCSLGLAVLMPPASCPSTFSLSTQGSNFTLLAHHAELVRNTAIQLVFVRANTAGQVPALKKVRTRDPSLAHNPFVQTRISQAASPQQPLPSDKSLSPSDYSSTEPGRKVTVAVSFAPSQTKEGYLSGGREFQQALRAVQFNRPVGLPRAHGVHSPKFVMVDPQLQGVAAVVKSIGQDFFGANNPACVDADAYSGMTEQELIARGLTRSDVVAVADAHGCVPKRAYR